MFCAGSLPFVAASHKGYPYHLTKYSFVSLWDLAVLGSWPMMQFKVDRFKFAACSLFESKTDSVHAGCKRLT
jgi:hypothetical protein